MADRDETVDVDDLPEMLPGETRAEWVERICGRIAKPMPTLDAEPFDPEKWDGVRKPFRE